MRLWILLCVTLLGTALGLPNPKAKDGTSWWESGNVYQIYPRSFQDTNGDGVGDLKGIEQRLDYIVNLGVNMVWLSPIFRSPMKDFGYDISSFVDIDPIFGTMEDFDSLMAKANSKGLKIVLDLVPNHSSDQHEWFLKSIAREDPYTDYYTWNDGKLLPNGTRVPINNWRSCFGGSAWEWNEQRGQYYLHQFAVGQPDLNYRNPLVVEEFRNILRFWLNKGAAGFRCDAVSHIFESPGLEDEPESGLEGYTEFDYEYYTHIYSDELPEVFDIIGVFRDVLQEYEDRDGVHRILFTEAYVNLTETVKYFGNETRKLADFPFNFRLITEIQEGFTGSSLYKVINEWYENMPTWAWANWVIGNHDNHRVASRVGSELVDAMNMLVMLLPGTPVTYNGEEIGMTDTFISYEDTVDPQACNYGPDDYLNRTRDPERTPFQWDNSINAGFSTANKTWLPMNPNYPSLNVAAQTDATVSHLKIYQSLIELRKTLAIQSGSLEYAIVNDDIFSFTRILPGETSYAIVLNVGTGDVTLDLSQVAWMPALATAVLRSSQATNPDTVPGSVIETQSVPVGAKEGIVLSFVAV